MNPFKNKFLGSDCVVFGNGPSLSLELIKKIQHKKIPSFAVNGFSLTFDKSSFRPTFACMSNYSAIQSYGLDYPADVIKFFKSGWQNHVSIKKKISNVYELPFLCSHELSSHKSPFIRDGNFTLDPFKENYCGDTVILDFAIPLAFYMGFKRIILCGVDTDYNLGYFDKEYVTAENMNDDSYQSMIHGDYSIAVEGYEFVNNFLLSKGRTICKLTESKRLNFIKTISFSDIS